VTNSKRCYKSYQKSNWCRRWTIQNWDTVLNSVSDTWTSRAI